MSGLSWGVAAGGTVSITEPGSLSFIPFAAWFSGAELGFWGYPKLADGLGLALEFVPVASSFGLTGWEEELDRGYCDITTRAVLSMSRLTSVDHSIPYMDITVGFVLRDYRRSEFLDRPAVAQRDDPRLAMPGGSPTPARRAPSSCARARCPR